MTVSDPRSVLNGTKPTKRHWVKDYSKVNRAAFGRHGVKIVLRFPVPLLPRRERGREGGA